MLTSFPETTKDREVLAELWQLVRDPWARTDDLADVLGVSRSCVSQWCLGDRAGPWAALRAALLRTSRRHPTAVAGLVEGLARLLLDARGRWVPADPPGGRVLEEALDVVEANGQLVAAVRRGASAADVVALARRVVVEADQVEAAARAAGGAR